MTRWDGGVYGAFGGGGTVLVTITITYMSRLRPNCNDYTGWPLRGGPPAFLCWLLFDAGAKWPKWDEEFEEQSEMKSSTCFSFVPLVFTGPPPFEDKPPTDQTPKDTIVSRDQIMPALPYHHQGTAATIIQSNHNNTIILL